MTASDIRAKARQTLLGLYNAQREAAQEDAGGRGRRPFFPVDLHALLLPFGWKCTILDNLTDCGEPISGKADPDKKLLFLDRAMGQGRLNFTLAHEIGHLVLHGGPCVMFRRDATEFGPHAVLRPILPAMQNAEVTRMEREANLFATELLMPERAVTKEFQERFGAERLWAGSTQSSLVTGIDNGTAEQVARGLSTASYPTSDSTPLVDFFGVSQSAMQRRLLELQLVY